MKFWFGWLLKGKCEISILDVLVLGFETFLAILFLLAILTLIRRKESRNKYD